MIAEEFFQDLCSGRARTDPASPDLFSEFFLFNQLSRIFHSKDHASRIVAFGRFRLPFPDLKISALHRIALFECRDISRHPGVLSPFLFRAFLFFLLPGLFVPFSGPERVFHYFEVSLLDTCLERSGEHLGSQPDLKGYFIKDRRRIKDGQKSSADKLIDFRGGLRNGRQCIQSLSGRNDRVVIRDRFVIGISRIANFFIRAALKDLYQVRPVHRHSGEPFQVLADLFGNRRGEYSRIGSGIGRELFLVQLLRRLQCLVRTDLEKSRAVVLKFCQIIEKRRVFLLFLAGNGNERAVPRS